jgi:hypothetical protein
MSSAEAAVRNFASLVAGSAGVKTNLQSRGVFSFRSPADPCPCFVDIATGREQSSSPFFQHQGWRDVHVIVWGKVDCHDINASRRVNVNG